MQCVCTTPLHRCITCRLSDLFNMSKMSARPVPGSAGVCIVSPCCNCEQVEPVQQRSAASGLGLPTMIQPVQHLVALAKTLRKAVVSAATRCSNCSPVLSSHYNPALSTHYSPALSTHYSPVLGTPHTASLTLAYLYTALPVPRAVTSLPNCSLPGGS